MGTAPSYDDNKVHDLSPWQLHQLTRNRAVQDMYEPGSTFKVVTFAAALSAGIIYPQMKFHLPYEIQVADRKIHDDAYRGPITLTASRILQQSSNVGTVEIARQVGPHLLSKWIAKFGFGKPTALGLHQEQAGSVLPVDDWYGSSIGNIPIGQGISVTPMQMAALYSTIANDGVLVEPHVIKQMQGRAPVKPTGKRIISTKVDHEMVNMLKAVLDRRPAAPASGADPRLHGGRQDGHRAEADPGGYSTTDYVASFVGFFPADDPQVEVMVVVDSPRGNIFGGVVAAPAFQQIGSFLTRRCRSSPTSPGSLKGFMELATLIDAVRPLRVVGAAEGDITAVTYGARPVVPGALHVCVPGLHRRRARLRAGGRRARRRRADRRARCSICRSRSSWSSRRGRRWRPRPTPSTAIPATGSDVVGITGTNGKTTTAFLLHAVLEAAGLRPGLLGTVEQRVGGASSRSSGRRLRASTSRRCCGGWSTPATAACVMEVSSHALELERVGRRALRRRRVHQPDAGPPRLPPATWSTTTAPRRGCSRAPRPRSTSTTRTAGAWRARRPGPVLTYAARGDDGRRPRRTRSRSAAAASSR